MNTTHGLRKDHDLIIDALRLLGAYGSQLEQGNPVDPADLQTLVEFFGTFADAYHHAKEEETLFPALIAAGLPRHGGPVAVMLSEHTEGRNYLATLRALAPQIADSTSARPTAATAIRQYCGLLDQHIAKENGILFAMADRLLAGSEASLADAWALAEKHCLPGGYAKWVNSIGELRARFTANGWELKSSAAPSCGGCGG